MCNLWTETTVCMLRNNFLVIVSTVYTKLQKSVVKKTSSWLLSTASLRRNRFHGLTSCPRRVKSSRFCLSVHWAQFSWSACMPKGHTSPWKVEFVYCQAEELKSKQISFMGWNLALEGWKVCYFGKLKQEILELISWLSVMPVSVSTSKVSRSSV